jgi:hypothetical protein
MADDVEALKELSRRMYALTSDPQYGMLSWISVMVDIMSEMHTKLEEIGVGNK